MVSVYCSPPFRQPFNITMRAFIVFAIAFVAAVSAQGGYGGHHEGLGAFGGLGLSGHGHDGEDGGHGHKEHYVDYHTHPHYHYDYAVHDLKHHDIKHQWETRDGDKVKGEYSLIEPDGTKRIVKYEADKHNGFNAVVERVGHAIHPHHEIHGHH